MDLWGIDMKNKRNETNDYTDCNESSTWSTSHIQNSVNIRESGSSQNANKVNDMNTALLQPQIIRNRNQP